MGALTDFFSGDHRRLQGLLEQAVPSSGEIDQEAYAKFREGLLRHIAMEERLILPAVVQAKGGKPLLTGRRLRLEHGAIASLLVLPPGRGLAGVLKNVLAHHDHLEEGPGALYEMCEDLLGDGVTAILEKARAMPPVPVLPHNSAPVAYEAAVRSLERAGFDVAEEELRG